MDGFEKRANKKKKQILSASYDLFLRHGVRKTTIQMIAKAANVSQVTIYNYYQSKENLLIEVARDIFESYTSAFEDIIYDSSLSFDEKLEAWIKFESNAIDELSTDLIAALYDESNKKMKALENWYSNNRISFAMEHLLREGKIERKINRNLDSDSVLLFIDLFKGVAKYDAVNNKKTLKDLMYLFFYGVGGNS